MRALLTNFLEPISFLLFSIATFLFLLRKQGIKEWVLFLYFLLSTVLMTLAAIDSSKNVNNISRYEIQLMLTAYFTGYYYLYIFASKSKKIIVIIMLVISTVYFISKHFSNYNEGLFDSPGYSVLSLSIVIFVFLYFNQILKKINEEPFLNDFDVWINASLLLYYLGCFFIFLTLYFLTKKILPQYTNQDRDLITNLWGFHNVLLFFSSVTLLSWSIWNYQKK